MEFLYILRIKCVFQNLCFRYKRFRDALSGTMKKKFKLGNDPLQHELLNHQKHMNDLIIDRVKDKMHFEIEKIRERDKVCLDIYYFWIDQIKVHNFRLVVE